MTTHGGKRDGAGRPAVLDDGKRVNLRLARQQREAIRQWAQARDVSDSEAARQMIDHAAECDRLDD